MIMKRRPLAYTVKKKGKEMEPDTKEEDTEGVEDNSLHEKSRVPDGGWGWMCVLGAAISHAVFGALVPSFGVTYLALLERYGESATATAWVGAINFACTGFLGPLASTLCRYYSCRQVTMAGGLLVATGLILTGFAPNIFVTYVTYGLIAGIGLSMTYTPAFIIVGQYFEKRRALAMAIAGFSTGIGALCSPPVIILILKEYGFRGMLMILGGFSLNICVAGALFRPLNLHIGRNNLPKGLELSNIPNKEEDPNEAQKNDMLKTLSEDQDQDLMSTAVEQEKEVQVKQGSTRVKSMKRRFGKLFKSPSFLALAFLMFCFGHALGVTSSFLPALAVENNIEETKAALLYTIGGVSCSLSTLAVGPILDFASVRRHRVHIYNTWHAIVGIVVLLQGIVTKYIAYACNAVIYNAVVGPMRAQQATVIYDVVGQISDAEGLGVALFFNSAGCLLGRALAGTIRDLFGEYNGAFFLAGSLCLFSSVIFQITLIRQRIISKRKPAT